MNDQLNQKFNQEVRVRIIFAAFGKVRISNPVTVSTLKYETIGDILDEVYRQTNTLSPTDLEHWRLENRLDRTDAERDFNNFDVEGMEFYLAATRSGTCHDRTHTSLSVGDMVQINPDLGDESTWVCAMSGWERFKRFNS